jgi:hypothetical protein
MSQLAPCIFVIGPANSGKSSLLHLLDEALQRHEDAPLAYVVKGNPDGSAHYEWHTPDKRGSQKGQWARLTLDQVIGWIENARRHLELVLVDVGGSRNAHALPGNRRLFEVCKREGGYYLAVARRFDDPTEEAEKGMAAWIGDAADAGLKPFAELESRTKLGDPYFDPATKKGLFRGDGTHVTDPLNRSLTDSLTRLATYWIFAFSARRRAPSICGGRGVGGIKTWGPWAAAWATFRRRYANRATCCWADRRPSGLTPRPCTTPSMGAEPPGSACSTRR